MAYMWNFVNMEQVLYSRFLKYGELRKIVEYEFSGSTANTINIFIDLFSYTRMLYRVTKYNNPFSICSAVVNYCGHLRSFFREGYNVESNIILVFSRGSFPMNRKYFAGFCMHYYQLMQMNPQMGDMIESNMKLLGALCHYLPDIYMKLTTSEVNAVIKYLIDKHIFPDVPNFIITDSQTGYQMPIVCKDTIVARKKRARGQDVSFAYDNTNCLYWYVEEVTKHSVKYKIPQDFRQNLVTAATALMGGEKLTMRPLCDIPSMVSILQKIPIGRERDMGCIYEIITDELGKKKDYMPITFQEFADRFCAVDLVLQSTLYGTLPDSRLTDFKAKMYDPDAVKAANNKYFHDCPINLDRL